MSQPLSTDLVFVRSAGDNGECRTEHVKFTQLADESDQSYTAAMQRVIDDWKACGWNLHPASLASIPGRPVDPQFLAEQSVLQTLDTKVNPPTTPAPPTPNGRWRFVDDDRNLPPGAQVKSPKVETSQPGRHIDFASECTMYPPASNLKEKVDSVPWNVSAGKPGEPVVFSRGIGTPGPVTGSRTAKSAEDVRQSAAYRFFDYGDAWQTPTPDDLSDSLGERAAATNDLLDENNRNLGFSGTPFETPDPYRWIAENAGVPTDRQLEQTEDEQNGIVWTNLGPAWQTSEEYWDSVAELDRLQEVMNYTDRYRGRGLGEKYASPNPALGAPYDLKGAESGRFICEQPNWVEQDKPYFERVPIRRILVPASDRKPDIQDEYDGSSIEQIYRDAEQKVRALAQLPEVQEALRRQGYELNPNIDWSQSSPDHVNFTSGVPGEEWPEPNVIQVPWYFAIYRGYHAAVERVQDFARAVVEKITKRRLIDSLLDEFEAASDRYYRALNEKMELADKMRKLEEFEGTLYRLIYRDEERIEELLRVNGELLLKVGELPELRSQVETLTDARVKLADEILTLQTSHDAMQKAGCETLDKLEKAQKSFDAVQKVSFETLDKLQKAQFLLEQAPMIDTTDFDIRRLAHSVTKFAYLHPMTFMNFKGARQYIDPSYPARDGQIIRIAPCPTAFVFTNLMPVNRIIFTPNPIPGLPGAQS